jgi:serine/threonine protein phosphatase 1
MFSPRDHGKVVVHGHTISGMPELQSNRIGIDTGAFATGRLTCLVLDGEARTFLAT